MFYAEVCGAIIELTTAIAIKSIKTNVYNLLTVNILHRIFVL